MSTSYHEAVAAGTSPAARSQTQASWRDALRLFVPGVPRPGGSKTPTVIRRKGGEIVRRANGSPLTVTREAGKYTPAWRADVKDAAARAWGNRPLLDGPLSLTVTFVMPRPKGHYGSGRKAGALKPNAPNFHTSKPDTTKLLRSLEDSLSQVVFVDDSRVVRQIAWKIYGDKPGAEIAIEELVSAVSESVEPAPLFAAGGSA